MLTYGGGPLRCEAENGGLGKVSLICSKLCANCPGGANTWGYGAACAGRPGVGIPGGPGLRPPNTSVSSWLRFIILSL